MLDCVGHSLKLFVGEGLKSAFDDFLAKRGLEEGKVFQPQFVRGLHGGLEGARLVGFDRFKFGLMFVAPIEEGWFGDVEMVGDASEAPALSTEVEELVYRFG